MPHSEFQPGADESDIRAEEFPFVREAPPAVERPAFLRRLLEISGKQHDSYGELAAEYLQLVCELLVIREAALNGGGAHTWHWCNRTRRLSSCDDRDLSAGASIAIKRRSGTEGRLLLPGRAELSPTESELAGLAAFSAGRALDHFREHAERIRRSVLEREREQVLQHFVRGGSIADALNSIAALVDRHAPNCRAAVLAIDGWTVECVAAPGLPTEYKSANSPFRALPPAFSEESQAAIRSAAAVHERARHIEIAGQFGFPWCESVPVLSRSGEMLGLFMAHCAEPPVRATREILRNVSRLASLVMDHRRLQIRAAWLAEHDALTGVGNGDGLKTALKNASAAAGEGGARAGILCISLDRFRGINGALGRTAGDIVLKRAAQRIRAVLQESDFVARCAGDEFVAVLTRRDADAVLAAANEIHAAIARPLHVEGHEVALTCSIGVSLWPDGVPDTDTLLGHAEAAMLRARNDGCGRIHTHAVRPAGDPQPSRYLVEQGLRNAAERNELELHYQPLVSMEGALKGFEVLLSWKHPEFGCVPARHFIPIAEEADLIVPIGEWVLRHVCRQAVEWRNAGPDALRFWVNVSARQFAAPQFAGTVRAAIADAGADPCAITLELTETAIMRDMEESARLMTELRGAGVRLAIDDFGTGYSSLNYLRTFPVHAIKIDQSFVRDVSDSSRALAVMETIVGLGHTLGLEVVAEGVETQTQLDILRRAGCDLAQGYLLGIPAPARDAEALLRAAADSSSPRL